jgi:hypothetical protein
MSLPRVLADHEHCPPTSPPHAPSLRTAMQPDDPQPVATKNGRMLALLSALRWHPLPTRARTHQLHPTLCLSHLVRFGRDIRTSFFETSQPAQLALTDTYVRLEARSLCPGYACLASSDVSPITRPACAHMSRIWCLARRSILCTLCQRRRTSNEMCALAHAHTVQSSCRRRLRVLRGACATSGRLSVVATVPRSPACLLRPRSMPVFQRIFTFVPFRRVVSAHHIRAKNICSHLQSDKSSSLGQLAVTCGLMHRRARTNTATAAPLAMCQDSTCPACDQALV